MGRQGVDTPGVIQLLLPIGPLWRTSAIWPRTWSSVLFAKSHATERCRIIQQTRPADGAEMSALNWVVGAKKKGEVQTRQRVTTLA